MTPHGKPTMYVGPLNMFGLQTRIAAYEKGLDIDYVMVPFTMEHRYEPKHPEVVRINPKRQVPVLVHGDLEIYDSTQIFEYFEELVPEPALWPRDVRDRARARLLEHASDEVYFPHIIRIMGLKDMRDDPIAVEARAAAADYYARMEAQLAGRDWLAGSYSFADIAFYMAYVFGDRMSARMTVETPRLLDWRARMTARPAVARTLGPMAEYLISQKLRVPPFMAHLAPQAA